MPQVLEQQCSETPAFELCAQKEAVLKYAAEDHQSFTWNTVTTLGLDWEKANRLSREIVLFSLQGMPNPLRAHAAALFANTLALLLAPKLSNGFEPFGPGSVAVEDLRVAFPEDVGDYLKSRQADGSLERLMRHLDRPLAGLLWLAAAVCLAALALCRRDRREDPVVRLAALALVAGLANAFFMSNLSGVYGRYQARLAFLLLFPALVLAGRGLHRIRLRLMRPRGDRAPQ